VVEEDVGYSLPLDYNYWNFTFSESKKNWGLYTYEQDWLDNTVDHLKIL